MTKQGKTESLIVGTKEHPLEVVVQKDASAVVGNVILIAVLLVIMLAVPLLVTGTISPRIIWLRFKRFFNLKMGKAPTKPKPVEISACFDVKSINMDVSTDFVISYLKMFKERHVSANKDFQTASLLLWGPPGTGKTEFVKYVANTLEMPLLTKDSSALIQGIVGASEKAIKNAFVEAEITKSILFFDEVDSFLQNRAGHQHSWEVTQVTQLLTQMENFKGIFFASTNFLDSIDPASLRRFSYKIRFDYIKEQPRLDLYKGYFKDCTREVLPAEVENRLRRIKNLAFGDFKVVAQRAQYLESVSHDFILEILENEVRMKSKFVGKPIGIQG